MAQLDDALAKIPRPLLVFIVLAGALALIVSQNPLSDGCEVEVTNFNRDVRGILKGYVMNNKNKTTQYAKIEFMKEQCVTGNNQGSCEDYFKSIKRVADATKVISEKCHIKLKEAFPQLVPSLVDGVKIMALAAWTDKPPAGIGQRLGWLTESDVFGFCRAKNAITQLSSVEAFKAFRASVYKEFPDRWPERMAEADKAVSPRPRALKSAENPAGSLTEPEVYERSLFSLRCDLYQ
jgi:hypothetical protein